MEVVYKVYNHTYLESDPETNRISAKNEVLSILKEYARTAYSLIPASLIFSCDILAVGSQHSPDDLSAFGSD